MSATCGQARGAAYTPTRIYGDVRLCFEKSRKAREKLVAKTSTLARIAACERELKFDILFSDFWVTEDFSCIGVGYGGG